MSAFGCTIQSYSIEVVSCRFDPSYRCQFAGNRKGGIDLNDLMPDEWLLYLYAKSVLAEI
jgi:hypothetical protein